MVEVINHLIDLHDQRLISKDELLNGEHAARKALKGSVRNFVCKAGLIVTAGRAAFCAAGPATSL